MTDTSAPRPGRTRRAGPAAAAATLAGLALMAAACGSRAPSGTAVASLPSATSSASASPASGNPVKYSQCMRAHGVKKFPDPNAQGGLAIDLGKLGMDPRSAVFKAAETACKALVPQGGGAPDPKQAAALQKHLLDYSKCMRANGIARYPDPTFSGNGASVSLPRSINPNSPRFKAADTTCRKVFQGGPGLPPPGGPGSGTSTGGVQGGGA